MQVHIVVHVTYHLHCRVLPSIEYDSIEMCAISVSSNAPSRPKIALFPIKHLAAEKIAIVFWLGSMANTCSQKFPHKSNITLLYTLYKIGLT